MSERTLSLAVGLTRAWVKTYTGGISSELRERRRAEIDSDLWEQSVDDREARRPPLVTALAITTRLLLGIPADLAWRFEQASARRSAARMIHGSRTMLKIASKNAMPILVGLLGAFYLVTAILGGLMGDLGSVGERVFWAGLVGLAGLLLLAGLSGRGRMPLAASLAIALGAVLGGVLMWWSFLMPAVALVILAWLLVGGWRRRRPAIA